MSFMDTNYPGQNVGVLPATPIQNYPPMTGGYQPQAGPDTTHLQDVFNRYMQNQQPQQPNGIAEQILANRFRPTQGDVGMSIANNAQSFLAPQMFQPTTPGQVMAQRYSSELSPYTSMLENQMKAGTQYMNMSGGGTGVLTNRMMQDNPGMSFTQALNHVQADPRLLGMGLQIQPGMGNQPTISTIPGAPTSLGEVKYGENYGGTLGTKMVEQQMNPGIAGATKSAEGQAQAQTAGPIAQATKAGDIAAEELQQGRQTNDIVGLYNKLNTDAKTTPSGALSSSFARLSNLSGLPTQGALSQARFDADLNNLYLATIRSLKGTGRVMDAELDKIGEAAPLSTDSNRVKMIKAQTHMEYYTQRMRSLGYDPTTGQPAQNQQGSIPNPPSQTQIQQQIPGQFQDQVPDAQSIVDELRRRGKVQ